MRRIVEVYEVPWQSDRATVRVPSRLLGPSMEDLITAIGVKFRIPREWMRVIVYEIFKYIDGEVARHGEDFYVMGFGRFHPYAPGGFATNKRGENNLVSVAVNRSRHSRLFTYQDDPEDVTAEELQQILDQQPELVRRAIRNRSNPQEE